MHNNGHHADHGAGLRKAMLAGGAIFLAWRAARAARALVWTAIGLGIASYWTGLRLW